MRGEPAVAATAEAGDDAAARATRCRLVLLEMIHRAGSGHAGSSLSCADIVSVLRAEVLAPGDGDVFVLSKGHAVPAWYAALVVAGDLPATAVGTLRELDSPLQGHPDRTRLDRVEVTTGALGQGLSMAVGRALGRRLRGRDSTVYCLLGDGECQEGQVWEAFGFAGARRVAGLVAVVDLNGSQSDGPVDDVLPLHPLPDALRGFGWQVRTVDGHDHAALAAALRDPAPDRPTAVLARTRKGRLGPGRVLLDGSHSALPTAAEYAAATGYLRGLLGEDR